MIDVSWEIVDRRSQRAFVTQVAGPKIAPQSDPSCAGFRVLCVLMSAFAVLIFSRRGRVLIIDHCSNSRKGARLVMPALRC